MAEEVERAEGHVGVLEEAVRRLSDEFGSPSLRPKPPGAGLLSPAGRATPVTPADGLLVASWHAGGGAVGGGGAAAGGGGENAVRDAPRAGGEWGVMQMLWPA
eukprot:5627638-Prymnesium_polylepis.1